MKNYIIKITGLCLLVGLSSCSRHIFYAPNRANVTQFVEKGELKLDLAGSSGNDYLAGEFQAAYSLTDKFAIQANYFGTSEDSITSIRYLEAAGGYYKKLNTHPTIHWIFEGYAGFGVGSTLEFHDLDENWQLSSARFNKIFVQPSIGLRSNYVRLYFGTKLANLQFNDISFTPHPSLSQNLNRTDIDYLRLNQNSWLIETTFGGALGYKYFWIGMNFSSSRNFTAEDLSMANQNINFSASLVLPLDTKAKK